MQSNLQDEVNSFLFWPRCLWQQQKTNQDSRVQHHLLPANTWEIKGWVSGTKNLQERTTMERSGEQEWGHRMFQTLQFPTLKDLKSMIGQDPPPRAHPTALEASCQGTAATETGLALWLRGPAWLLINPLTRSQTLWLTQTWVAWVNHKL